MAATDTLYRNVKTLNVVFAVTSLLMLATIIGMFAEDYYRDWKVEQRSFRDVEEQMAVRGLLAATPSEKALDDIEAAERQLREARAEVEAAKAELGRTKGEL